MKKIISLILTVLIFTMACMIPSNAAAIEDNTVVMPLWDNISTVSTAIAFGDSNDGNASGGCSRKSGVELLEGTLSVFANYNGAWFRVAQASGSAEVGSLGVEADFYCESGRQYRAEFKVTAYKNGVAETFTDIVYETCP